MPVRSISLNAPPKRIAIIKPSALGDIVHSLPVLTALRRRFPEARISWIVNTAYAPILDQHPDLNEVIRFDRGALRRGFVAGSIVFGRFLTYLRGLRFDLVIDLQGLLRTGLMTRATGAPIRIGLASAREGSRWCYTHTVDDRTDVAHAIDRYWRVAEAIDPSAGSKIFHVPIAGDARAWAQTHLATFPQPWLAVGVGSRWLTKRWPPEHFASLIQRAQAKCGGTAVFVGTREELPLAEQSAALVRGPVCQLTGVTTLPQLAAVLGECDVMIANDTGPLHLAVALGRPVVAPYTCTLISKTGPYGQADRAVATSVSCHGSYLKTCPHMNCMAELTPERLWPVLEAILQQWQHQHQAA